MSKNVWGPATWNLLHCLVLKIDDNIDQKTFEDVKTIISGIANNLPCPTCTEHAATFLKKNNFKSVANIETLRYFIFYFHNKVNERLKKPQIRFEEHIQIYANMNLKIVVDHFFSVYRDMSQISVTMMLRSYHRTMLLSEVNQYFMRNQSKYRL